MFVLKSIIKYSQTGRDINIVYKDQKIEIETICENMERLI